MIIGIDASRAFLSERTGIEEYAYQVIKHLRTPLENEEVVLYMREDNHIEFQISNSPFQNKPEFQIPKKWRGKVISLRRLWTQVGLSLEMWRHPVGVLFVPAHTVPLIHPRKTIVVIHGLEYEFCPKAYSFLARIYMRWSIRFSCRAAWKIIAVSQNTKRDLVRLYGVPEEKIVVIYEGVSENSKIQNPNFKINPKSKFQNSKFLLFIGRLEERKNIMGIIAAFEILKEKYHIPHKLVLAGKPGYGYASGKQQAVSSKQAECIIELGYVSEEEKRDLLKNAAVFLFPTLYEGFGLPILEAQSAGTPVVTSNLSSLPEVAGRGALLVDPRSSEAIAEAVYTIISDEKVKGDIIAKGYENVKRFSWERCGREIAGEVRGEG